MGERVVLDYGLASPSVHLPRLTDSPNGWCYLHPLCNKQKFRIPVLRELRSDDRICGSCRRFDQPTKGGQGG